MNGSTPNRDIAPALDSLAVTLPHAKVSWMPANRLALGRNEWTERMAIIGAALEEPLSFWVVDGAVGLLSLQDRRANALRVALREARDAARLTRAALAAGVSVVVDSHVDPAQPTLVVVESPVPFGHLEAGSHVVLTDGKLCVFCAPPALLVALLLSELTPQSVEDLAYLGFTSGLGKEAILLAAETLASPGDRARIAANAVLLDVLIRPMERPRHRKVDTIRTVAEMVAASKGARARQLAAHHLLMHRGDVLELLARRQWASLLPYAEAVEADVSLDLAATDPALFRTLRKGVTEAHARGLALNLSALRALAASVGVESNTD